VALKEMTKKLDVNRYVKLKKVMRAHNVLSKVVEGRTTYRLILSEETVGGQRRIECTYADGTRIHGKNSAMPHPVIVVSARDQDEILWVAKFPFEIRLKNGNPFFRTFPAKAVRGADHLYRVASGPVKATGGPREKHEFGAYRLLKISLKIDSKCDYLDPHFIVDP
jgi:hypothetical protein